MTQPKCEYETTMIPPHKGHPLRGVEIYHFASEDEAKAFNEAYQKAREKALQELLPEVSMDGSDGVWSIEVISVATDLTETIQNEYFRDVHESVDIVDSLEL